MIRLLIEENKYLRINLYGSVKESLLINNISEGFDEGIVLNLCGKTNLKELSTELASCDKVIGNDSGGMHLSNAVGTESIVLFGPTNQKVTAPTFDAPLHVLQPPHIEGENTGDENLENLSAFRVFEKFTSLL